MRWIQFERTETPDGRKELSINFGRAATSPLVETESEHLITNARIDGDGYLRTYNELPSGGAMGMGFPGHSTRASESLHPQQAAE